MPHYHSLLQHDLSAETDDLRGSPIYGADGAQLGEIEDVLFDHATGEIRYAVIATQGRLGMPRILGPAQHIRLFPLREDAFTIDLTTHQASTLPPYEPSQLTSQAEWARYERQYKEAWNSLALETVAGVGSLGEEVLEEVPREPEDMGETLRDVGGGLGSLGEEVPPTDSTARGRRWDRFQELLKKNRVDITANCPSCAPAKEGKHVA